jgi:hypothetical protein
MCLISSFYFFHPYIKLCAINREGPIDSVQTIYPFLLNDWCKPNSQWKLEPPNEGKQKSYTPNAKVYIQTFETVHIMHAYMHFVTQVEV